MLATADSIYSMDRDTLSLLTGAINAVSVASSNNNFFNERNKYGCS